jgi:endonuclease YncB( thermonuclease family)
MPRRRRKDLWPRVYRRHPAALLVLILISAAIVYSRWRSGGGPGTTSGPAPVPGSDYERYNNVTAVCTQVVDGDTLHIKIPDGSRPHTKVRLWGVDTPEIGRGSQPAMHFGPEAFAFTRKRVEGQKVRIVLAPNDTRDRYERLLAYVYYGQPEEMLNAQLVREGYAYADHRYNHPWRERFLELEDRARRKKLGLWANVKPQQIPDWKRKKLTPRP